MSSIPDIKQRVYLKPSQLLIIQQLLQPIVMNPPTRDNHKEYVLFDVYVGEILDKIYNGQKRPEYIPVASEDRLKSKPINAANMGLDDGDPNDPDIMNRKLEVVGYKSYEDAFKASGFSSEDEMMAYSCNMTIEEYLKSKTGSTFTGIKGQ